MSVRTDERVSGEVQSTTRETEQFSAGTIAGRVIAGLGFVLIASGAFRRLARGAGDPMAVIDDLRRRRGGSTPRGPSRVRAGNSQTTGTESETNTTARASVREPIASSRGADSSDEP